MQSIRHGMQADRPWHAKSGRHARPSISPTLRRMGHMPHVTSPRQACKAAGGSRLVACEFIPQVLPLFSYQAVARSDFGSSTPSPRQSAIGSPPPVPADAGQAAGADESAYWDLVYVVYPEVVEAVGIAPTRQLVPSWRALEASILVSRHTHTHAHTRMHMHAHMHWRCRTGEHWRPASW